MANPQLQSDSAGFIVGQSVLNIHRQNNLLSDIKNDIHQIKIGMANIGRAPILNPRQDAIVSVSPRSSSNVVALPSRGSNTRDAAAITPRRDNVVTPERGANGRFVSSTTEENPRLAANPSLSTSANDGNQTRAAFNGMADRISASIVESTHAASGVDPTIGAANEVAQAGSVIAQPLMRGYQALAGGHDNNRQVRWYRKIFGELRLFRRDETVFNRAANRSLHNLENMPQGGGDSGGGMLGVVGLLIAGLLAKMFGKLPEVIQKSIKSILPAAVASRLPGVIAPGRTGNIPVPGGAPIPAAGRFGRVGKLLKKVPLLGPLLAGFGAYSEITETENNPELSRQQKDVNNGGSVGGSVGGLTGALAFGSVGAAAGPVGAIVMSIIGWFGGEKLGDIIGRYAGEAFSGFRGSDMQKRILETWDTNVAFLQSAWDGIKTVTDSISEWASKAFDDVKTKVAEIAAPVIEQAKENAGLLNESIKRSTGGWDIKEDLSLAGQEVLKVYGKGKAKAGEVTDILKEGWQLAKESVQGPLGIDGTAGATITGLNAQQTQALTNDVKRTESKGSGGPRAENAEGFIGQYQFGADALADSGLIHLDKLKSAKKAGSFNQTDFLNDSSNWKIAGGKESYLGDTTLQDKAFIDFTNRNIKSGMVAGSISKHDSAEKIAGYAKAAHIAGSGGANDLFLHGIDRADSNGTKASKYARDGSAAVASIKSPTVEAYMPVQTVNAVSNKAPIVTVPTFAKPAPIVAAPVIPERMGSDNGNKGQTTTVTKGEVGQDVQDRKIAHLVTGGLSG